MNRGQVLYRVAELMEGRRDQFVAEVAAAEGLRGAQGPRRSSTGRSTAGSGTPGWADKIGPGARLVEPGARRRTSTSRSPSRPASSGSSRPRRRRCSGSSRGLAAAAGRGQCRRRPRVGDAAARRRSPCRRCWRRRDVPGGVVNLLTGLKRELVPVLAAHVDVDSLDVWGAARTCGPRSSCWRPRTSSGSPGDPRGSATPGSTGWTTAPPNVPSGSRPCLEMKTVWHPIRT